MDVNGSRTKLLLGEADWAACIDETGQPLGVSWQAGARSQLRWDAKLGELTLTPEPFEFPVPAIDQPVRLIDRRGAGRDVFGNWYWIGAEARDILVLSAGDGSTSRLWPAQAPASPDASRAGSFTASDEPPALAAQQLSGATVTDDNFLVVGTLEPSGLLVFDLQAGGPPMHLPWPEVVAFEPFDLARRPGGGAFVLDAANRLAWELDRLFHVVPAAAPAPAAPQAGRFEPISGARGADLIEPQAAQATRLTGTPISIEAAPGGGFLVLDRGGGGGPSLVACYRAGRQLGASAPLADPAIPDPIVGHDMAVARDMLFVADSRGVQCYAFTLTLDDGGPKLTLTPAFYPMRRFGGKGLVAAGSGAHYDFADRWIPLVAQPLERYPDSATITTPPLDSNIPGCEWHRVMIDARMPAGTRLRVWSVADDQQDALALARWQSEPDPLPRRSGSELPYVQMGPYATSELLLQQARGRYLKLKLELVGNGRATPRLRAVRVWYPRFSYLERYLPGVYREDPDSASFLTRYLANFEGLLTSLEDRIAAAQLLLGPASAPGDALEWLAGWVSLSLDPLWDERRRRLFIAGAMRFFGARGTIRAIEIALRFVLDPNVTAEVFDDPQPAGPGGPRIVETFRTRSTPGVVFGDPTDASLPRAVMATGRWNPDQGRDVLNARYASFLHERGLEGTSYPLSEPSDGRLTAAWREFSTRVLGFVPQSPSPARWRAFLAHRYPNAGAAFAAHRLTGRPPTNFSNIDPPDMSTLPPEGAALRDWFQFQSVVLPMERSAHRFTVLLPWPLQVPDSSGDPSSSLSHDRLRDLARRVVELQKPAHTVFDIKFFWAAFRVGEVRLGFDTTLASGSRVPELIGPALLGRDYLGASYLTGHLASDSIRRTDPDRPATTAQTTTAEEA